MSCAGVLRVLRQGRGGALRGKVRERSGARHARTDEGVAAHAEQLAREGLYSKAAAALEQGELAPASEDTHSKLQALHPNGSRSGDMPAAPNPAPQPPPLDPALFLKTFRNPARGSAHGCSGWRMEHCPLVAEHVVVTDSIESSVFHKVASAVAAGRVPPLVRPHFAGGRLIGLMKPAGGVRPIVIGEALRRLVGKLLITQKGKDVIGSHFAPARFRDPL